MVYVRAGQIVAMTWSQSLQVESKDNRRLIVMDKKLSKLIVHYMPSGYPFAPCKGTIAGMLW